MSAEKTIQMILCYSIEDNDKTEDFTAEINGIVENLGFDVNAYMDPTTEEFLHDPYGEGEEEAGDD